jgi:hypothetical protein
MFSWSFQQAKKSTVHNDMAVHHLWVKSLTASMLADIGSLSLCADIAPWLLETYIVLFGPRKVLGRLFGHCFKPFTCLEMMAGESLLMPAIFYGTLI